MAEREQRLAIVVVARDLASKSLRSISKELGGLDKAGRFVAHRGVQGIGTAIGNIERGAVILGGAAAGAGVAAVKMAMDYESSAASVRKTVEGNIDAILESNRTLARTAPLDVNNLNEISAAAGALGVAKDDIASFTETIALLGVTTDDVDTQLGAEMLGHLRTNLKLAGDEFERTGNTLVYLGNNGASTEGQILAMAEGISGAAQIVNASTQQVLGWAAAVANTGEEAEAGGSSIQRFWLESAKSVRAGGKELKLMAKVAGTTAKEFQAAFGRDATGTLARFLVSLGKLSKGEQQATLEALGFTDIRITRALLKLLGNTDNLTDSLNLAADGWRENNAMTAEAEKRFETAASQFKILENNIRLAGITVGQELLPELVALSKEGTAWLKAHPDEIKAFAEGVGDGFREAVRWAKQLDFDAIATTLKAGAEGAKGIAEAFMNLPPDVQKVLVGLFAANKLTGGAVSDIGGALVKGALGSALGRAGGLFSRGTSPANPMWVAPVGGSLAGGVAGGGRGTGLMNGLLRTGAGLALGFGGSQLLSAGIGQGATPFGLAGGIGGAAGMIAGGAMMGGPIGAMIAAGLAVGQTASETSAATQAQAAGIRAGMEPHLAAKSLDELNVALAATKTGIEEASGAMLGLGGLVHGGAIEELRAQQASLEAEIARRSRASNADADRLTAQAQQRANDAWSDRLSGLAAAVERGARAGTQAGIQHSSLFREAAKVRGDSGLKSGAFLRREVKRGTVGKEDLVVAQAMVLGLRNALGLKEGGPKDAADLKSARYQLETLVDLQRASKGDMKTELGRLISELKAAIANTPAPNVHVTVPITAQSVDGRIRIWKRGANVSGGRVRID